MLKSIVPLMPSRKYSFADSFLGTLKAMGGTLAAYLVC
jgi:hypothetical protein